MNMLAKDCTIDPTLSVSPATLNLQSPAQVTRARLVSNAASPRAPSVPLSDAQMRDCLDLMFRADELLAAGRRQEANRVKQVASNILRTGAPALE